MIKTVGAILAFVVAVAAQDATITDGLLEAQADLSLGHEFFETTLFLNRGQISAYMYRINNELITSHINAYAAMKTKVLATDEIFDGFEVNPQNEQCLNSVRNRWNLQVTRFGHRLSSCISVADAMLNGWNRFLNEIHSTGQVTANQVQNLGIKVLAETEIFDDRESFPRLINREFRDLLAQARPYRDRFDGFLNSISLTVTGVIEFFVDCDREIAEDLTVEIREDLALANNCVAV